MRRLGNLRSLAAKLAHHERAGRWTRAVVIGALIGVGLAMLFVFALTGECIP